MSTQGCSRATHHGRQHGLNLPMLEACWSATSAICKHSHADDASNQPKLSSWPFVQAKYRRLRESAMVEAAQIILGRGYRVRIYDPALNLAFGWWGAISVLIDIRMPHLASLLLMI